MHPTFSNYSKGQRVPGYQQQSGQTIYNIGAFGPYPITMSHAPANIFVNQPQFHRTFASVVSCENPNSHHYEETPVVDNSGILNSFIKRLSKQPQQPVTPQPQLYQQYTQKEFEDFTKMPTVIKNPQSTNYTNSYSTPPPQFSGNFDPMKMPFMNQSAYYQSHPPPPKQQQQHHHTPQPPRNNFLNTIWGNFYSPQQHQPQQTMHQKPNNNNQRWYQRGFHRFRCNRNNNHTPKQQHPRHSRFHHSDVNNAKHMHEKERNSIERDIKNDYCDINYKSKSVEDQLKCNNNNNNNTETARTSTSNDCDNCEVNPPFEIFSLEEFPAIPSTCNGSLALKQKEVDQDHDFVTYKDDAAVTTPTYTPTWPKRISLCEKVSKIVKSPQKLLPLALATPRRSCLKPTQRNRSMSECSDDFIVFEYSCDDGDRDECCESDSSDEDDCSDDDNESDISDDTIIGEGSEDIDEVDDGQRKEDERMQRDYQPDSGIDGEYEPKKVSSRLHKLNRLLQNNISTLVILCF